MAGRKKAKRALVPELRFPEFEGGGDWCAEPLHVHSERITERVGKTKLTPVSITAGQGFVDQTKKFGRDISGHQYQRYIRICRGDFAYNKGSSKRYRQGCIYRLREFDEAAASAAFICFKLVGPNEPRFFQKLFENNVHGRELSKFITSGARSDGLLNISASDFFGILLPRPPGLEEQQKIADCLSSLDALIEGHEAKLLGLRVFSKGFLKKLFPAQPGVEQEMRLNGFKQSWIWKTLPQISENLNTLRQPITAKDRINGDTPYYGASGVVDFVEGYIFDEALLCVSEDGANLLARTSPIAFPISGKTWVNNHAHVLRFTHPDLELIVEHYLNSINLKDYITGMAQPKLNKANLEIIPIPVPPCPEERQKIADCLGSLDALIQAERDKIEALKLHKKGLMQKLFPQPEGGW